MSFFNSPTDKTAGKDHRCIWCGQKINKGDRYTYHAGVFDGDWQSNHYHPECFGCIPEDPYYDPSEGFVPYENDRPVRSAQ